MKLSKKQSFNKSSSHRRLWLSFIITLFILATSVSAYFLVKNSQDIRKSASDPYQNDCICLYNSTCSAAGMKPCEGSCSPACSAPQICCQPITNDLCTQGERYCVDANRIATCKPDRSGYTISNCTNGTSCNSQQKLCIADPTPNPAATCQQNGGECIYNSSCSVVNRSSLAGTCPPPAVCCGASLVNNCTQGNSYCVDANRVAICKLDRSGYTISNCATGTQCDSTLKACKSVAPLTPTCQGTCYTNTSCSAIGKVPASGTCRYDTSICCKEATTTTPTCEGTCYTNTSCTAIGKVPAGGTCLNSTSICCKEADSSTPVVTTGTNCEGSCYDASSCDAIGKRQASGSCAASVWQVFNGLVCCKENVLAAPGSLGLGDPCIDDSECATGNCNNWARYEAIGPGVSYANYQCLSSEADQQVMVDASNKAGMVAVGIEVALMGGYLLTPAIQSIIGLAGGSLSALPTAAYSYATATIATAPAWVQTGLSVAGVTAGWAGVIAGQYACTTNNQTAATRAACDAYLAEMIGNPADMLSLATATGGLLDDAGKAINRYLHPPVIIPDSHSDLKSLKAYLQQQGVIDAYGNPTGKKAVFLGDYFGKSTNQLTGESLNNTPGIDVLNFVTDLQNKSPNSVTLLAGNWEPRYAVTMAAQDMDYTEQVDILVNGKGVSQFEIDELINDRALTREQFAKLNYITYLPDGSVAQHADTAELMRYALSENDLSTLLNSSDPALQQLGIDFINIQTQSNNLSVQNMKVIQEAIDQSNLSPNQIVNNINYNGQSIVDNALSIGQMNNPLPGSAEYSAQVFMYQDVANFHSQISSDLKFFEPGASDYVSQMASTLQTNTIVFGHTPNRDLVNITLDSNLTTSSNQSGLVGTFQNTGITIKDFDINLSRGMNIPLTNPNHPKGFWPRIDGVIQVPENLWLNISPIVN